MKKRRLWPHIKKILRFGSPVFYLNAFFDRYTGGLHRPAFFDIDTTFPALNEITRHYAVIRDELEAILASRAAIPRYHDFDLTQHYVSGKFDRDKDWRVFMLYAMGERPAASRSLCPRTCALLDEVPDLFQAFFSILDAGKSIPGHRGTYRGYLRYHLALKVPVTNPPLLRVKDQWRAWKEGEAMLFDDSQHHEVVNTADDIRVVLIVDVLRPMPRWPHAVNRLMTQTLIRYTYAKGVFRVSAWVSRRRRPRVIG